MQMLIDCDLITIRKASGFDGWISQILACTCTKRHKKRKIQPQRYTTTVGAQNACQQPTGCLTRASRCVLIVWFKVSWWVVTAFWIAFCDATTLFLLRKQRDKFSSVIAASPFFRLTVTDPDCSHSNLRPNFFAEKQMLQRAGHRVCFIQSRVAFSKRGFGANGSALRCTAFSFSIK